MFCGRVPPSLLKERSILSSRDNFSRSEGKFPSMSLEPAYTSSKFGQESIPSNDAVFVFVMSIDVSAVPLSTSLNGKLTAFPSRASVVRVGISLKTSFDGNVPERPF